MRLDGEEACQLSAPLEEKCQNLERMAGTLDNVEKLRNYLTDARNYEQILQALEQMAPPSMAEHLKTIKEQSIRLAGILTQKINAKSANAAGSDVNGTSDKHDNKAPDEKQKFQSMEYLKKMVEEQVKKFSCLKKSVGMIPVTCKGLPWYKTIASALIPGYYPHMNPDGLDNLSLMDSWEGCKKDNIIFHRVLGTPPSKNASLLFFLHDLRGIRKI